MNKTQYAYYIFVTSMGKGYGCYSIKQVGQDEKFVKFVVSASYCHPSDRKNFSKRVARDIADSRRDRPKVRRIENLKGVGQLSSVIVDIPVANKEDTHMIVDNALLCGLEIRPWAAAAYNKKLYFKTLSFDYLNWQNLVLKLVFESGEQLKIVDLQKRMGVQWLLERMLTTNNGVLPW